MKLPNYFSYKLQKQTQRGYKSFTRQADPGARSDEAAALHPAAPRS